TARCWRGVGASRKRCGAWQPSCKASRPRADRATLGHTFELVSLQWPTESCFAQRSEQTSYQRPDRLEALLFLFHGKFLIPFLADDTILLRPDLVDLTLHGPGHARGEVGELLVEGAIDKGPFIQHLCL